MNTYREGDSERFIWLRSDDGVVWTDDSGNEYREGDVPKVILLRSDDGEVWQP